MGTLHRFAETAIRRDLLRTREVLVPGDRLAPDRRAALVEHVLWLTTLVDPSATEIRNAAHRLGAAMIDFHAEPERAKRDAVLQALDSLLRVTGERLLWTCPEEVRRLGPHVPWLLDGVAVAGGPALFLDDPGSSAAERRRRAAAYRRTRVLLWGTVALTASPAMIPLGSVAMR